MAQEVIGGGVFGPPPSQAAAVSIIQSIQRGTVTLGTGIGSTTATLGTPVSTTNSMILYNGRTNDLAAAGNSERVGGRITLSSSNQVTVTRLGTGGATALTLGYTVVEFASGVNSIQSGTITVPAGSLSTSVTLTTPVSSFAFITMQGYNCPTANQSISVSWAGVTLTSSNTVSAFVLNDGTNGQVVGYQVIDLSSGIVTAVQPGTQTSTTAVTSDNATISSVSTNNTLVFDNGFTYTLNRSVAEFFNSVTLSTNTNIAFVRMTAAALTRTHYYTAVTFSSANMNSYVQRGNFAMGNATTSSATLSTPVDTSKSFLNLCGFNSTSVNWNVTTPRVDFVSSNTINGILAAAGNSSMSYEVIEFI